MKRKSYVFIFFLFLPIFGFANFNNLDSMSKSIKSDFNLSNTSLQIVQKKWLDKKYLSEFVFGIAPILRGVQYINSYSLDFSYRFFLNENWSFRLQYSTHRNFHTKEGKREITDRGQIPLEVKYSQKQSYFGGFDWYPFYGKVLLYNQLVYLNLYLSVLAGKTELFSKTSFVSTGSLSLGSVFWWNRHVNTRFELQGFYYNYDLNLEKGFKDTLKEFIVKTSLSLGVFF